MRVCRCSASQAPPPCPRRPQWEREFFDTSVTHYHQVERGHGAFARTFEFGTKIATEAVSADLADGVLTITLPKAAPQAARKIEVR
jgi:HSP20 family molecular chaperone IbpA